MSSPISITATATADSGANAHSSSPTASADSASLSPRLVTLTVATLGAVTSLQTIVLAILEPAIGRELNLSPTSDVFFNEAFLIATVLVLPLSGWLMERIGLLQVLTFGALGSSVFGLVTTLVASNQNLCSFPALLGLVLLQGLASAPLSAVTQALVIRTYPEALRSHGIALCTAARYGGFASGALLAGPLSARSHWQLAFAVSALVCLLPLPGLLSHRTRAEKRQFRRPPGAWQADRQGQLGAAAKAQGTGKESASDANQHSWSALAHDHNFVVAWSLTLAINAMTTGQFEILLLAGPLAVGASEISMRSLLGGLSQLGAAALGGPVLDRLRIRRTLTLSLGLMAVGAAGYTSYGSHHDELTILWTRIILGVGGGLAATALATHAFSEAKSPSVVARASALFALAPPLGTALGLALLDVVFGLEEHHAAKNSPLIPYLDVSALEFAGLLVVLGLARILVPKR